MRGLALLVALATLAALGLLLARADRAAAAAPLGFSVPEQVDVFGSPTSVSCASEALCILVDSKGNAFLSSDPIPPGASWVRSQIDGERALSSVSCTAEALCVAVDEDGFALVSTTSGQAWTRIRIDEHERPLLSVSCASRSLCAAVDSAGSVLVSTHPGSGPWPELTQAAGLRSVSCAGGHCTAAGAGTVAASVEPERPHSWSARAVDAALSIDEISCEASGTCVAVDESGQVLASADPSTWSSTPVALGPLGAVSCAASGLCLAAGTHGEALASDDPAAPTPAWSEYRPDGGADIAGVSCLEGGLCVAVDSGGRVLAARVPAPTTRTSTPAELAATTATLTGTVDANDAVLSACDFEYGTTTAYGIAAPCAAAPAPAAGEQPVGARLASLEPNTTYHYRLLAASAAGTSVSADATLTTAASSAVPIVFPHPSISGTAAVSEKLTCSSGTPAGADSRLAFQWLRNQVPIPGASSPAYTVKGADNGAHLQCSVTSTDGGGSATAISGFANVPYQSPPASNGETSVARASSLGERITVAVTCAADAPSGCRIVLRASTLEKHRRVTLAAGAARVPAAQHRNLLLTLAKSARRLLAARHRLTVRLTVTGTVLGVIEASLSQQTLVLTAAPRRARKAAAADAVAPLAAVPTAGAGQSGALSPTPYMGWDTYFAFGGHYDEATILMQASQLLSLGLARDGYRLVWLDVGWWQGARTAAGEIVVNRAQWPHGLAWLASTLHAAGLRIGLYTDAGRNGCGGVAEGSYGHYQQDVDEFASWGFDAVKVDFCGGSEQHLDPAQAYSSFHAAIAGNSSRRPMLLDVCDFLQPGQYAEGEPTISQSAFTSYTFGPGVANSWRTDTDVGSPGHVNFSDVLRNMDADAAAPQAAGPGHWNDPDYLGPDQGLSATQFRTQFSMWSMLAAPLMISDNLRTISSSSLATVSRAAVIAVDQDPAGLQGTLLSSTAAGQVWVKPLAGGARAVALLNRGTQPLRISVNASALNFAAGGGSGGPYIVENLWSGARSSSAGVISAVVAPQSTVLLRVSSK